jgi:ABC-2 type transport system permease protein
MRIIYYIARWEFFNRFKTRSFLFSTFILPILFSLLITLPVYFITYEETVSTKLIGLINLNENDLLEKLQEHLNINYKLKSGSPEYIILPISVENSPRYRASYNEFTAVSNHLDSLNLAYNNLKNLREKYYRSKNLQHKQYLLKKSYDELITTRELKEMIELDYEYYKVQLDSVYNEESRLAADSLLLQKILNAYLVLPKDAYYSEIIEYHSYNPGELLDAERMQKILNEVILQLRLLEADVKSQQINQWLKPVRLNKYQLRSQGPTKWDFYIEFYGAVIGVVLLFMAIFTSGGFLFSSVLQEKTDRMIELLLSYASSLQIMAGKIFGLGLLGLMQVLIWLCITAIFVFFNLFQAGQISYLNIENGLYFLHYFSLGYLLYAAIFVAIGAIFSSEQEAQQVNIILRTIAILPVLLVFLFLKEPDSEIISFLSYIPLLTPYFMILKIAQFGIPLATDVYITSIILIVSIIGMVFIAAKIFRMGILMYGKKFTFRDILVLLRSS